LPGESHVQLVLEKLLIASAHRGDVERCAVVVDLVDLVEELGACEWGVEACGILQLEVSLVDALSPAEGWGDNWDVTSDELFKQAQELILLVSDLLHSISRRAFSLGSSLRVFTVVFFQ